MQKSLVRKKRAKRAKAWPMLISAILPGTLSQAGLEKDYYKWQIFALWDRIVGKNISQHAQPVRMTRDVLQVVVSHSTWMQELQFMKRELIDRLNREMQSIPRQKLEQLPLTLTPIKEIRFVLGTLPKPTPQTPRALKKTLAEIGEASPEVLQEALKETGNIADEELRAMLQHLWIKTQNLP